MDDSLIFARYYNLSLRFLSYRPRSEKEVYDYLLEKSKRGRGKNLLNEKIIAAIMQRLAEYKFVNDLEFAKWWIGNRRKAFRIIKLELSQKGISKEIIEEAATVFDLEAKEESLLIKLIEKKMKRLRNPTKEEIQKVFQYLMRKGFDYAEVAKAMKSIKS